MIPVLHKLFQEIRKTKTISNLIYKDRVNLILKPNKAFAKWENYRLTYHMNAEAISRCITYLLRVCVCMFMIIHTCPRGRCPQKPEEGAGFSGATDT